MRLYGCLRGVAADSIVWILATYGGFLLSRYLNIIPHALLPIPQVFVDFHNLDQIFLIFLLFHIITIFAASIFKRKNLYLLDQFALVYILYLVAFTLSVYVLIFGTVTNFDPQMTAAVGVLSSILLFVRHLIFLKFSRNQDVLNFSFFWKTIRDTIQVFKSVLGFLVLLFFMTPFILGVLFFSNPSAANLISKFRIVISEVRNDSNWILEEIYPNLKLHQPMMVRFDPGDENSIYVLERTGRLLRLSYSSASMYDLVIDFRQRVGVVDVENGALGFDFHPKYEHSKEHRFVYIYYTSHASGKLRNRLSRFELSSENPATVLESELALFDLNRSVDGYHNGGAVEFGPDGFLYVGMGEGIRMSHGDSIGETLREGIIRIDVDMRGENTSHPIERQPVNGSTSNYFIPNDNPFLGSPDAMEEFWAVGLRNPFRMGFDDQSGALWVGDVGSTKWEEVNHVERGKDYQYPYMEGYELTEKEKPATRVGVEQQPVFAYQHTASDRAIIGGGIYRGTKHPSLTGHYIFADSYSAKLFYMSTENRRKFGKRLLARGDQYAQRGISSVTFSPHGDVIATILGGSMKSSGQILRLARKKSGPDTLLADLPKDYDDREIEQLFRANCGRCHGGNGAGDGPDSAHFGVPMPNFASSSYFEKRSIEEIKAIIANGGEAEGMSAAMPPWKDLLHDQEITVLAKYIRQLGGN